MQVSSGAVMLDIVLVLSSLSVKKHRGKIKAAELLYRSCSVNNITAREGTEMLLRVGHYMLACVVINKGNLKLFLTVDVLICQCS